MECTHCWTVTSPCPYCQSSEIELLKKCVYFLANNGTYGLALAPGDVADKVIEVVESLKLNK